MLNFTGFFRLDHMVYQMKFLYFFLKPPSVQRMKQVKINGYHIQLLKLFLQNLFKIPLFFHLPNRKLVGQIYLFPVTVLQSFSYDQFAGSIHVRICGIHIIHPIVNCMTDHADGFQFIGRPIRKNRKTHSSKPQCGNLNPCTAKRAILHTFLPPVF